MCYTKRAINSKAVLKLSPYVVAVLTIIVSSAATNEKGFRAAEHTFPCNVFVAMLWTSLIADSESFNLTFLAEEIIFRLVLHKIHFFFTVNKATKERLQTAAAFIERAAMQGEIELAVEIEVALCCQTLILVNAHLLCFVKCFLLDKLSQLCQNFEFLRDWWAVWSLD